MVLARRQELEPAGMAAEERQIAQRLGPYPELVAELLGSPQLWANDSIAGLHHLELELGQGCWIIVLARPAPLQHVYSSRRPPPSSRHGTLLGSHMDHALVLIAADHRGYGLLDPWLEEQHQPVWITREEFVSFWVGVFISVPCSPPPP